MTKLKINPDFKDLIPPLSQDELTQLTQNIIAEGCRDAIKTWNGTIVDGHNRYAICRANGIPYSVSKVSFPSKKDAVLWILENQMGRRNLTEAMHIKLALLKAEALRGKARQNRSKPGCEPIHIRKAAARATGVSEGKVHMFMKVQELGDARLIQRMEAGEIKISAAYNEAAGNAYAVQPANAGGLAVTTRKVEVYYDSEDVPDINNITCATAVLNKVEIAERLYRMIVGECDLVCCGDGVVRVAEWVESQIGLARDIAGN